MVSNPNRNVHPEALTVPRYTGKAPVWFVCYGSTQFC